MSNTFVADISDIKILSEEFGSIMKYSGPHSTKKYGLKHDGNYYAKDGVYNHETKLFETKMGISVPIYDPCAEGVHIYGSEYVCLNLTVYYYNGDCEVQMIDPHNRGEGIEIKVKISSQWPGGFFYNPPYIVDCFGGYQDDYGGYMDKYKNYAPMLNADDGGYYDTEGQYHDSLGGIHDIHGGYTTPNGKYVHPVSSYYFDGEKWVGPDDL